MHRPRVECNVPNLGGLQVGSSSWEETVLSNANLDNVSDARLVSRDLYTVGSMTKDSSTHNY
jgi:hypothetical protein